MQTNNKQYKVTVTLLFGYHGFLNVTNKNNKIILLLVFEGAEYF